MPIDTPTIVLDPGHGGDEVGAVGSNGLAEKDLNLAVAQLARDALEEDGEAVVLTRTADYRVTVRMRAAIAAATQARVFVSIHHNGAPRGDSSRPGTEVFYQNRSRDSPPCGPCL